MRVNVKVLFFFLALLALAFARPNEPVKPKPSPTPPPPPPKKCVGEILCCQSLGFFTDITVSLLLGLLGIELSASEKGLECGLTCTAFPLHKRDADFW